MGHFGEFSSQPINRFSSEETKANTTKSDMHWNQRVLYHRVNVKTKPEFSHLYCIWLETDRAYSQRDRACYLQVKSEIF